MGSSSPKKLYRRKPLPARQGLSVEVEGEEARHLDIDDKKRIVAIYLDFDQQHQEQIQGLHSRLRADLGDDVLVLILPKDARLEVIDLEPTDVGRRRGTWDL